METSEVIKTQHGWEFVRDTHTCVILEVRHQGIFSVKLGQKVYSSKKLFLGRTGVLELGTLGIVVGIRQLASGSSLCVSVWFEGQNTSLQMKPKDLQVSPWVEI